jgi:hypothetical protein
VPQKPLTHHEIVSLIEPFARQGRHADLEGSDRLRRTLVFKPVEHPAPAPHAPSIRETLELSNPADGGYRLVRTLTCGGPNTPPEARLEIEGGHPADLLACVDAVAPESQFSFGRGYAIARSYRLLPGADPAPGTSTSKILTHWRAELDGLSVAFTAPARKGDPEGDIELRPTAGSVLKLPEDLLAVQGWDWELLDRKKHGWRSGLRLRGAEPERSRRAEMKLEGMAAHLARTLAEAPSRFHERWAAARWGVALRRAIPVLIFLVLLAGALATSRLHIASDSGLWMVLFNAPPLLFLLIFCMRKLPRIEIPPLPRRSKAPDWRDAGAVARVPSPRPLQPG